MIPRPGHPAKGDYGGNKSCLKTDPYSRDPLKEFCEETSMHGFKYLLPEYGPIANRIFWFLVLLLFSGITIYQVIKVLDGFAKNPTVVNTDKKYPDSLDFPVVIICNSMSFRVSQVQPKSVMHQILSEIYDTPNINTSAAKKYEKDLAGYDTGTYLRKVAFDKNDMIVKCSWQRTPCSPNDFVPVILGSRICYAFNTGRNGSIVRNTTLPGQDYGLALTLNVEYYEQMEGPHDTIGILVGLSNQNSTVVLEDTINTMVGSSTKIAIRQVELNHLKGVTCDDGSLKYSNSTYSRDACVLDRKIEAIKESCGCYPYFVDDSKVEKSEYCNLYQHFSCAEKKFAEFPQVSYEECPGRCHQKLFEATVSQAAISWERSKASLDQEYAKNRKLKERVLRAIQDRYRYDPERNETFRVYIESLRNSSDDLTNFIHEINNVSCSVSLDLPPAEVLPNVEEQFEQYMLEISTSSESYAKPLEIEFSKLNNETKILLAIFENNTAIDTIANNGTIARRTIELGYIAQHGLFRLTTLSQWVDALAKIKEWQEWWLSKHDELAEQSWRKILEANETEWLSQIDDRGSQLGNNNGCLSDIIYQWQDDPASDKAKNISVIDMLTCSQYYFAGPSARLQKAATTSTVLSFTNEHMVEDDLLLISCNQLLCETMSEDSDKDCEVSIVDMQGHIIPLLKKMLKLTEGCLGLLSEFQEEITKFGEYYRENVLAVFAELSTTVAAYRDKVELVQTTLNEPIWPLKPEMEEIISNVTSYESDGLPLFNLSNYFVYNYSTWLDDVMDGDANAAKKSMTDLILATEQISNYTEVLQKLYKNDTQIDNATNDGMFATFSENLWQNTSVGRLEEISECTSQLKNETEGFLATLPELTRKYSEDVTTLTDASNIFLEEIDVNEALFKRDFMTVTIYFTEISVQVVTQEYAYTFWSLMADIGGTVGLWLGFSITSGVEIITLTIRYIVWFILRKVRGSKGKENVTPTDGANRSYPADNNGISFQLED